MKLRRLQNENTNCYEKSRKIEGAKKALEHYFKDFEIKGIPVESNVPGF